MIGFWKLAKFLSEGTEGKLMTNRNEFTTFKQKITIKPTYQNAKYLNGTKHQVPTQALQVLSSASYVLHHCTSNIFPTIVIEVRGIQILSGFS